MITIPLPPHPALQGITRRVLVPRVDSIDYEQKTVSILIRIEHLNADGSPNTYLGTKTDFMFSSNAKLVNAQGEPVVPGTEGALGEFDWLMQASETIPLPKLILAMIQRNIDRGNFNSGNYRD